MNQQIHNKHNIYERLGILIGIICLAFTNGYSQNLKQHKWENRILIIKTSDENSANYATQLKQFQNAENELKERKLILYHIIGDTFSARNYVNDKESSGQVSTKVATSILNADEDFEIILIGLDGGIKRRQKNVFTIEDLMSIIDAMPMRKYEIKH